MTCRCHIIVAHNFNIMLFTGNKGKSVVYVFRRYPDETVRNPVTYLRICVRGCRCSNNFYNFFKSKSYIYVRVCFVRDFFRFDVINRSHYKIYIRTSCDCDVFASRRVSFVRVPPRVNFKYTSPSGRQHFTFKKYSTRRWNSFIVLFDKYTVYNMKRERLKSNILLVFFYNNQQKYYLL